MELLSSYKEWLVKRFKKIQKENKDLKDYIKDVLLKNMVIELHEANSTAGTEATRNENVVYYVAGYLILRFKRKKCANSCTSCLISMETGLEQLPDSFSANEFTKLKNRGGLRFPSTFALLKIVEQVINDFCRNGSSYGQNAFLSIIQSICLNTLPQVGCQLHHENLMMNLIYDYMLIRFNFIAKQKNIEICQAAKRKKHTHNKLAKI